MKNTILIKTLLGFFVLSIPSHLLAAAGGVKFIDYYEIILTSLGVDHHSIHDWSAVLGAVLAFVIISIIGFSYKKKVEAASDNVIPEGKFGVRSIVESLFEFVYDLTSGVIGKDKVEPFLPLLTSLFVFIFICNLSGLVPGFIPATDNISTNMTLAIMVFLVYNYAGIKEHGVSYIKQFIGPVVFLMPLMFVIELVGHLARPISLSLRLYGNIFGDHLVLSVFTGLTVLIFPAFFLFFGLLVASIQSFVFTLLSSIYISMAISHDH